MEEMDVLSAVGGKEREIDTVFKKNFVCGLPMTKTRKFKYVFS